MESIKEIFRIGKGPSSSHTMAPRAASQQFLARNPKAARFVVTLYGSLAATGKGHMTNTAILEVLSPAAPTEIVWKPKIFLPFHPNGMHFEAYDEADNKLDEWTTYSIGGGALADENSSSATHNVYEMTHLAQIQAPTEIVWKPKIFLPFHPNGMHFEAYDEADNKLDEWTTYSIGGGALADENSSSATHNVYEMTHLAQIQAWCERTGYGYWEYVEMCEGKEIWDYLTEVWKVMQEAINRGLETEGVLPGGLGVRRKAADYLIRAKGYTDSLRSRGMIYSYALATSEENAAGGIIVTAPTCGSCGVLPAVLYHLKQTRDFRESRILRAIATAGLFGNVATQMHRFPVPRSDAREKWGLLVPWPLLLPANFSEELLPK